MRAVQDGEELLQHADDMEVAPLDDKELNEMLLQAYQEQHGGDEAPVDGAFQMLLFEGIDLQQDALSPDYVPAFVPQPVVPTLGPDDAVGHEVNSDDLIAASLAAELDKQ
jgi:hypothetical protein